MGCQLCSPRGSPLGWGLGGSVPHDATISSLSPVQSLTVTSPAGRQGSWAGQRWCWLLDFEPVGSWKKKSQPGFFLMKPSSFQACCKLDTRPSIQSQFSGSLVCTFAGRKRSGKRPLGGQNPVSLVILSRSRGQPAPPAS